jgi:hypothetical protein
MTAAFGDLGRRPSASVDVLRSVLERIRADAVNPTF